MPLRKSPSPAEVADGLHSAAIHLLRRVRKQDLASGLGPARLSALSVLVFGGPTTLGNLAAAEQIRPPTMSRIVAGLEREGLLAREADPTDARLVRLRATARGARLLQEGRARRVQYLAQRLSQLSKLDLVLLNKAIRLIQDALRS